jgi:hypothetical protein
VKSEEKKLNVKSPYLDVKIYHNYAKAMKEKNCKRKTQGLNAIYVRSFEEWSGEI